MISENSNYHDKDTDLFQTLQEEKQNRITSFFQESKGKIYDK